MRDHKGVVKYRGGKTGQDLATDCMQEMRKGKRQRCYPDLYIALDAPDRVQKKEEM